MAFVKAKAIKNFTFLLRGLTVNKFPVIECLIGVGNESSQSFALDSITGDISINGNNVGSVKSFQKILIAANKQTIMRISLTPAFGGITTTFLQMFQIKKGTMKINMVGTAQVNGINFPLNLNYVM